MKRVVIFGFVAGLAASLWACGGGDKAPADTQVPDTTSETAGPITCNKCEGMEGWAFRINYLFVTEPKDDTTDGDEAVRDFLNTMWTRDIDNDVLNILFQVKTYDVATGKLTALVGPGQKTADGKFHMLCGYDQEFEVDVAKEDGCKFKTPQKYGLNFHAGALDKPVNCAPEIAVGGKAMANAIPISGLDVPEGVLSTTCDAADATKSMGELKDAYLKGFIAKTDADLICSCNKYDKTAGQYTCEQSSALADPASDMYCIAHCNKAIGMYTSFGYFVEKTAKIGTIKGPDGVTDGYQLAGNFDATKVDNFDPKCCNNTACTE